MSDIPPSGGTFSPACFPMPLSAHAMLSSLLHRLVRPLAFIALPLSLSADPALIEKARAYLGPDAALDSVESLRMTGALSVSENDQPLPGAATIEILFQKPDRQRITATSESRIEVTALDGYDAWSRVATPGDPASWQMTLLPIEQIKRLRANTFENLAFYRGHSSRGVRIEDRGPAVIDGVACRKLAFIHGPDIVFTRSFDVTNGRLMLTETDNGTQIREEGEIRSGGLRFPSRIITVNRYADGSTRTIRVEFSEIVVNPDLPADTFAMPMLSN